MKTFMNRALNGEILDIDDFICEWHENKKTNIELHEYLGLTLEEYAEFVEKDKIGEIVERRKFKNLNDKLVTIGLKEIKSTDDENWMNTGRPGRWWDDPTWRCTNNHVSKMILKSSVKGDCCLACGENVTLTFPEDKDGELKMDYVVVLMEHVPDFTIRDWNDEECYKKGEVIKTLDFRTLEEARAFKRATEMISKIYEIPIYCRIYDKLNEELVIDKEKSHSSEWWNKAWARNDLKEIRKCLE